MSFGKAFWRGSVGFSSPKRKFYSCLEQLLERRIYILVLNAATNEVKTVDQTEPRAFCMICHCIRNTVGFMIHVYAPPISLHSLSNSLHQRPVRVNYLCLLLNCRDGKEAIIFQQNFLPP